MVNTALQSPGPRGSPDTIHLCFSGDAHFACHIRPLFASIAAHHSGEDLCVHFLFSGQDPGFQRWVRTVAGEYGLPLAEYDIEAMLAAAMPEMKPHPQSPSLTRACYGRWLLADVLPASVDRVIYSDLDVLFLGSLRPLLDAVPRGVAVAAAPDQVLVHSDRLWRTFWSEHLARLGLAGRRDTYVNSGFLVMSLATWRRERLCAALLDTYRRLVSDGVGLWLQDQDVLNVHLKDNIHPLPPGWNVLANELLDAEEWRKPAFQNPQLIHYCGPKPWRRLQWMELPAVAATAFVHARAAAATHPAEKAYWAMAAAAYAAQLAPGAVALDAEGVSALKEQTWAHAARVELPPAPEAQESPSVRIKCSCLVNNYNYAPFVVEAVTSALAQTRPFDEIIVVDDGSTDDSLARLHVAFDRFPQVRIVAQANGGQLSAFNRGFVESTGEILFFLDADDLYHPTLLEEVLVVYQREADVGMVFMPVEMFGKEQGLRYLRGNAAEPARHHSFPTSAVSSIQLRELGVDFRMPPATPCEAAWGPWIGSPTSGLSFRRRALDRVLPLETKLDFRTRADDILVFGAAMAGAIRYYLHCPLVRYQNHGANAYTGRSLDESRHHVKLRSLMGEMAAKLGVDVSNAAREREVILNILRPYAHVRLPGRDFRRAWRDLRRSGLSVPARWRGRWTLCRQAVRNLLKSG